MIGFGSLIAFGVFCYAGPWHGVRLGLTDNIALMLDAFVSLIFFIQHSVMVRKSFRRSLAQYIPEIYIGTVYAISSGIALFMVLLFWQRTSHIIATADGPFRWFLRIAFAASMAGFYWTTTALSYFDPFGIRVILLRLRRKEPKEMPLTIKGPYRYIRHPLYLFILILIWSCPDLTLDRLVFNILWTVWIYIGTLLEERDLIADFGETYKEYQQKVPMLVPWRL
jgi:protein-S-isoprenylcysteine O-methyltransferase Ste14